MDPQQKLFPSPILSRGYVQQIYPFTVIPASTLPVLCIFGGYWLCYVYLQYHQQTESHHNSAQFQSTRLYPPLNSLRGEVRVLNSSHGSIFKARILRSIVLLSMQSSQPTTNYGIAISQPTTGIRTGNEISLQTLAFERASDGLTSLALKDILNTFRRDVTEVLPNLDREPQSKQRLEQKLANLEKEVEGLLHTRAIFPASNGRELDYSALLLEKDNEIISLQRRINALEVPTKVTGQEGVAELRAKIAKLNADVASREDIIKAKNEFIIAEFNHYAEVRDYFLRVRNTFDRTANKGELRSLFEGIQMPPTLDRDFRNNDLTQSNQKPRKVVQGEARVKAEIEALTHDLQSIKVLTQQNFEGAIKSFFMGIEDSKFKELFRINEQHQLLNNRFKAAVSIWTAQINSLKRQFPAGRIDIDKDITKLLQDSRVQVFVVNDVVQLQPNPVVEVPMSESRTSQLLQVMTSQLRGLVTKYPKLEFEVDRSVLDFFNEGVTDSMVVGSSIDRIVQIVKYIPQEVRVDNIYSFRSDKHSRVEYHLRVLVKALLEELQRLRTKTGQVLQLDEGIIKMIREEIMDIVNVDDILKVFRVNTKIVEVEKVIEKIVERIVEVPQIVLVQKIVEKIIEVPKIQEIERIVHVPVEIIKYIDNIVEKIVEVERVIEVIKEVPKYIEKIVEKIVEVPKIVEIEKIVEKVVVETTIVEVDKIIEKTVIEIKEVEIIREVVMQVEKVIEKLVEVPVYVEKIVERVVNIPQIVEVEKIVEKIVRDTQYKVVKQNNVEVEVAIEIVDRVVEKIVIVDNYIEKVLEVPKIVEKIVAIREQIFEVREVEVIREKIVPVYEVKEVERVVNTVTPLIQEVEKIIDRRVEVPIIQERIVTVPQIINRVEIQRVEVPRIIEVEKVVEKIVIVNNIVEIEKPVIHYVKEYQVVKSIVEKIVPIPKIVERIKEVKVTVDKLIEKMVEIPKVIEIEKIVEKIVVVPRIIEKIVEVPQIIEIIVERIVEVEKIIEIEKEVQVPIYVDQIVEIEVVKNVYVEVEKVVEKIVEKIVPFETIVEKLVEIHTDVEKVVAINVEVARQIEVEKIVVTKSEVEKIFEIEKPVTVTVEVPVQVERIVEKVVVIEKYNEKIVQVPQLIEKIVEVNSETVQVEVVEKIVERIIPKNVIQTVVEDNLVVQNLVKEVPQVIEKLVPVIQVVNQIVEVERIIEKVIERVVEVPKVVEIERIVERIVRIPEIQVLQKIVPQLILVNNIVETIIEKIVSVPFREEVVKIIESISERIVPIKETENQITSVEVFRDKIVEVEKLIEIAQINNLITKQLEVVERFEEREIPIFSTIEKIIQVPHILEKIVERIVILPQVVEILKNVHQIAETLPTGISIPADVAAHETQYRSLASNLRKSSGDMINELRKIKTQQPTLRASIEVIERMLSDLEKAVNFSRIVAVPQEVITKEEVSRPVVIQGDLQYRNHALALSLLTEKLVHELRRLKQQKTDLKFELDDDVSLIFFPEIGYPSGTDLTFNTQLRSYTESVLGKFRNLGGWKTDHELLLFSVLQEKFTHSQILKDLNVEVRKIKEAADQTNRENKQLRQANSEIQSSAKKLETPLSRLFDRLRNDKTYSDTTREVSRNLEDLISVLGRNINSFPVVSLEIPSVTVHSQTSQYLAIQSQLRESLNQVETLKNMISQQKFGTADEITLREENARLRDEITRLRSHRLDNEEYERIINDLRTQLSSFSSTRTTLYNEEQLRNDYEKKLKEQTQNYEKLLNGLRSGSNVLTPNAIQFIDKPIPGKPSNENRLENSRISSTSSQANSLLNSRSLTSSNVHAIGHANVLPGYYYLPGQQPTFRP